MRIALLGCGSVGYAIAYALAEDRRTIELKIFDSSYFRAAKCSSLPLPSAQFTVLDLSREESLEEALRGVDLAIDALPGSLGFRAMKIAAKMCVDMVSVSFTPEDPIALDDDFRKCGAVLIPDAGFAPGLSNLIVGRALAINDRVDEVCIYVGGLPAYPTGPLRHSITWSPDDFIDEYLRPARIIEDGEIRSMDPLSSTEIVDIPSFGQFEAFYSDGLRTLLHVLKGRVRKAFEKTIRYRGHIEAMKILRDLGLMSDEPIKINGIDVPPRRVLAKLLERQRYLEVPDLTLLYVEVYGEIEKKNRVLRYLLWSRYDEARDLTAMAKTTGFAAYAMARLIISGKLSDMQGVIPPEILGMQEALFTDVMSWLTTKGIHFRAEGKYL